MAVNVRERERERDVLDLVVQFRRLDRLIRTIEQFSRSLCSRRREFRLLTLDIICRKKRRGIRFVIKNIVSIGSIFFFLLFSIGNIASFGGIFVSIGIISPLCQGSLFERRESLFLRYPVCTGKYFSVNISAQERLHLVIERYPKLFRCLQDFQFSLSNVSLSRRKKERKKERRDLLIKRTCVYILIFFEIDPTISYRSSVGNETSVNSVAHRATQLELLFHEINFELN